MTSVFCFFCIRSSISADGLRCSYCENDESGTVFIETFHPPSPEPGYLSPEYYETAENANTQTMDEDRPRRKRKPSRKASTWTAENDLNLMEEVGKYIGQRNYTEKNGCLKGKTANHFHQNLASNSNRPSVSNLCHKNTMPIKRKAEPEGGNTHDIKKKECGKCKKRFYKKSGFYAHIKSNCNPFPFKCDVCHMTFSYESSLIVHRKKHGEKSIKCNLCDFTTVWQKYLKEHLKIKHKKMI